MEVPPTASTSAEPIAPPAVNESTASAQASSSHNVSSPNPPSPAKPFSASVGVQTSSVDNEKRAGRNLVLLFDGTGNACGTSVSNVSSLLYYLSGDERLTKWYYQSGIGTSLQTHDATFSPFALRTLFIKAKDSADAGLATTLKERVLNGYHFLMNHYRQGDAIFLFGFSRGAYTARVLCGMLQEVGLLPAGNMATAPLAWTIHQSEGGFVREFRTLMAVRFKEKFARAVEIQFVGVFDTVSSIGGFRPQTLSFSSGSTIVRNFRQALSPDERRVRFTPELWKPVPGGQTTVKEVWFAGSHSDVGGGEFGWRWGTSPLLSHLSFRWMLREAVECGLHLDATRVKTSTLFSPFWDRATAAVEGTALGQEGGADPSVNIAELDAFLRAAREHGASSSPVAACVYLASLPSAKATQDALGPRSDRLSPRFFSCTGRDLYLRTAYSNQKLEARIARLGWWSFELLPQARKTCGADGQAKKEVLHPNLGRGRLLPSSPVFHSCVRTRLEAPIADVYQWQVPLVYPERNGYQPAARFQPDEDFNNVVWVD